MNKNAYGIAKNLLLLTGLPKTWIDNNILTFIINKDFIQCLEFLRTKLFEENSLNSILKFGELNLEFHSDYYRDLIEIAQNVEELNKVRKIFIENNCVEKAISKEILSTLAIPLDEKISKLNKISN